MSAVHRPGSHDRHGVRIGRDGIGEDGRQEHGVAITGPGDFGVGFFHRDGEPVVTTNEIEHEVEWEERDGRRLPLKATIEFGGRRFFYRPSGNVTLPTPRTGTPTPRSRR